MTAHAAPEAPAPRTTDLAAKVSAAPLPSTTRRLRRGGVANVVVMTVAAGIIGTLAIPGLGPFIAAGPLMAALSGAAVGAAVGGVAGTLIGMGIPEFEAKRYEGKIRGGNVLLSVHVGDSNESDLAKEIFKNCGAEDISTSSEASVPREKSTKR